MTPANALGVAQDWLQREVGREDALSPPAGAPNPEADFFALSDDDDFAPLDVEVQIVKGRYVLVSLRNAIPMRSVSFP